MEDCSLQEFLRVFCLAGFDSFFFFFKDFRVFWWKGLLISENLNVAKLLLEKKEITIRPLVAIPSG